MSCAGSSSPSGFGSPSLVSSCPPGQVLVGADVDYVSPSAGSGASGPLVGIFDAFDPADPIGPCRSNSDCVPPQVCADGRCADPPPAWIPGAVQGISAFYCAGADAVHAGGAYLPARTPTGVFPGGGATATFVCPAGQALTGATAWVDDAGAVEQIQFRCSGFDPEAPEGEKSPLYPAALMPMSTATPVAVSTSGPANTALFANSVAQAPPDTGRAIRAFGLGCQDYKDEFDSSSARRLACCTGAASNPQFCQGYAPQTGACDVFMAQFCAADCGPYGGCTHPQCGCLGSPVGRPECYDSRCADTPAAYLTAPMAQQKASCPTTVSCAIWQALDSGVYLAEKVTPPAGCAPPPAPGTASNPIIIALVVGFILLLLIALVAGSSSSDSKKMLPFVPPPPAGLF